MKLLFDIGNTSVNWAVHDGNAYRQRDRFAYREADMLDLLQQHLPAEFVPDTILIASVASDKQNRLLHEWLLKRWQLPPWYATVDSEFAGLTNSYVDCNQMGIDRWLAMLAAWLQYRTALCVVDSGTALTIDCIQANGQHAGGYILPGLALMQQSLLTNTSRISAHISDRYSTERAMNTQSAISSGASLALVGAIERALTDFQSACSEQVKAVITGGSARQLASVLGQPMFIHDALVLDGLRQRYEATT